VGRGSLLKRPAGGGIKRKEEENEKKRKGRLRAMLQISQYLLLKNRKQRQGLSPFEALEDKKSNNPVG